MTSSEKAPLKTINHRVDICFLGGGLSNGLLARRLSERHPHLSFCILEKGPTLGGDHTWSFHDSDFSEPERAWLAPFVEQRWPSYQVGFDTDLRTLNTGYQSMTSDRFHRVLSREWKKSFFPDCEVTSVDAQSVQLSDGSTVQAELIFDGRGLVGNLPDLEMGYQKFIGLDLELDQPHGLQSARVMDARCPQLGGFRFFYVLPWTERRLMIEDTRYTNHSELQPEEYRKEILQYATQNGWKVRSIGRQEQGVLPIPLTDFFLQDPWPLDGPIRTGLGGGYFQHVTGYSIGEAVRVAEIATDGEMTPLAVQKRLARYRRQSSAQRSYELILNRMLFLACEPEQRRRIFARFYCLPEPLIQRFYSGRLGAWDRARILMGKPPVPVHRALSAIQPGARRSLKKQRIAPFVY